MPSSYEQDEYIRKMELKLSDETTYRKATDDPTERIKQKLISQLNQMEEAKEIDEFQRRRLLPKVVRIT